MTCMSNNRNLSLLVCGHKWKQRYRLKYIMISYTDGKLSNNDF